MKNIQVLTLGAFQVNCYLIEEKNHWIIIDPGSTPRRIIEKIGEGKVEAILLTHGHFDHIGAVEELVKKYHCPVYISEEDEKMLRDVSLNGSYMVQAFTVQTPVLFYPNHLSLNGFDFDIFHAPGHTLGSVCLCMDSIMFSGDVLFKEGIGRTDLNWASPSQMVNTLNEIRKIIQDYVIYPGHGPSTTLFYEFEHNPYLR